MIAVRIIAIVILIIRMEMLIINKIISIGVILIPRSLLKTCVIFVITIVKHSTYTTRLNGFGLN